MFITLNKLEELCGISQATCRQWLGSWRLSKYQFYKRMHGGRKYVVLFNGDFINDFAQYLKLKRHDNSEFKNEARKLLKIDK